MVHPSFISSYILSRPHQIIASAPFATPPLALALLISELAPPPEAIPPFRFPAPQTNMAYIPPSTWAFAPARANAPSSFNPLLSPLKRIGSLKPISAASGVPLTPDRKSKNNSNTASKQDPVTDPTVAVTGSGGDPGRPEIPASIKIAMEKAREYKKNKGVVNFSTEEPRNSAPEQNPVPEPTSQAAESGGSQEIPASVKLAMEKAREYKKNKGVANASGEQPRDSAPKKNLTPEHAGGAKRSSDLGGLELPASVKLTMGKTQEYKKDKGMPNASTEEPINSDQDKVNASNLREGSLENKVSKKEDLKISSTDFLGLGFSETKRYRGLPPGLAPAVEPLLDGNLPEVEIIVGDTSKFEVTDPSKMISDKDTDNTDLYKPKISTWGVFPRPSNISKTFGGGRVIRPGEDLETTEDKAAKEKRSRELIAAYKSKMGLTIDAKLKAECEKALKEGDKLMDLGKLREALPFYEKVMKDLVFQSELHGLAALHWSVCQDSLRRSNEARVMYEKLQSHPNAQVSKKARQFVFSFQATEMMKVTSSSYSGRTGYEDYFEAFVENKVNFTPKEEEQDGAFRQGIPYIMFLMSPIFIVFLIAVRKSFRF